MFLGDVVQATRDRGPRAPRWTALGLFLLGAGVLLLGWSGGLARLIDLREGWPQMAPATAATFMVVGAALWTTAEARCSPGLARRGRLMRLASAGDRKSVV
jgi:drug/metabolite transporter (DMT)-like permease